MRVPLVISVWDDGYGISVPIEFQTTKGSISEVVSGFYVNEKGQGLDIYVVNGWDYAALVETYEAAVRKTRESQIPCLVHVKEVTQPQGHSTSGSHERYKTKERLEWERDFDCIKKMREWMLSNAIAEESQLDEIETAAKKDVQHARREAWDDYLTPIKQDIAALNQQLNALVAVTSQTDYIQKIQNELNALTEPLRRNVAETARGVLMATRFESSDERASLSTWTDDYLKQYDSRYNDNLYSSSAHSALNVPTVEAQYDKDAQQLNGFEILNKCFDDMLSRDSRVLAFGEDLGRIGDVNQGFAGLQQKHGDKRVFDVGIREATIIGQGIGMALRGLRPIAEIQYLDYLLYGLQPISDDLATLRYRSANGQQAPLIIRTRGHRLEGIWHTGSPMGMILNSVRGVYLCVPRNMVQAAGFYNLLLQSDDPAIVVEPLNGYRLKEQLPTNLSGFTVPLGQPEVLRGGDDVTLVTYGSCCRVASSACDRLQEMGISVELLDVQTLLPFDLNHVIAQSVKKTNRLVFLDEDVPGGATAYMMQQVMEHQDIFRYLDALPRTLAAKANRAAYGSDGDYFCKPGVEDVVELVYDIMHEADPGSNPKL